MTQNWNIEYEQGLVEAESAEDVRYASDPENYVPCVCGRRVLDGSVCRYCGEPTESWIAANSYDGEPDESMDGDHESALASVGWGMDEDYGCFDSGDY